MELLYRWRQELLEKEEASSPCRGNPSLSPLEAENARLRKQLREAELVSDILKKDSGHHLQGRWQVFRFIKGHRSLFPIKKMCKALGVNRSAYYAWLKSKPAARTLENQRLTGLIRQLHQESNQSYGSPRNAEGLRQRAIAVFRPRVARLMRLSALRIRVGKRFRVTTDSSHRYPVSENLLNRNFTTTALA